MHPMDFRMAVKIYDNFICPEFSVVWHWGKRKKKNKTQTIDEQDHKMLSFCAAKVEPFIEQIT